MYSAIGLIIIFMCGLFVSAVFNTVREFNRDKKIYKQERARLVEIGKNL
jgi:hypothetical protein